MTPTEKHSAWIRSLPPLPMFRDEFDALPEYSATMPTGTTPGKRWRRHDGAHDVDFIAGGGKPVWLVGEYDPFDDGKGQNIRINWYVPVPRIGEPAIIETLVRLGCRAEPCGSRVTCEPAPTDTDVDYLVEIPPSQTTVSLVVEHLSGAGFTWEGGEHYQQAAAGDFMSWRDKENRNLIVTSNACFAHRHRTATALCKKLNLLAKPDRIAVFQAVLYGNDWNGENWSQMKAKRMALTVAQS